MNRRISEAIVAVTARAAVATFRERVTALT